MMNIDKLSHTCFTARKILYIYVTTIIAYIKCYLWGVEIKRKCKFTGIPFIKKIPGSNITIHCGCNFISSTIGNSIGINHPCILTTLSSEAEILIEANGGFSGVTIAAEKKITIKANARIGANTIITDTDWHSEDHRAGIPKEVIIGEDVWIGVNTTVLKGVKIGKGTLIGANSVVTKSIPPHVAAAGNPCVIIKQYSKAGDCLSKI